MFVNGDTVIGERTYFKLYKSGNLYLPEPVPYSDKYLGAIRDTANKFFYVAKNLETEVMLYDFNLNVGDFLWGSYDYMQISEIDTLNDGRKIFSAPMIQVHCGSSDTFIEGIGWLAGLLEGNSCYYHPGIRGWVLMCYSEDGETVYKSRTGKDRNIDCFHISSIQDHKTSMLKVTVRNNELTIYFPEKITSGYLEVIQLTGQVIFRSPVNNQDFSIFSINELKPGTYLVMLKSESRNMVGKFSKF
ncbi:MAG: T9SS type A sorting domain-containing protein [Bacteroidales bacterium]|nr:T9SS type A sorting domain-containing protein [Bacteroidales bacterium]